MDTCRESMQEQGSANSNPANDNDGGESPDGPMDHLCARCKAIDFYEILCDEQEILTHPQEPVAVIDELGPVIDWDTDSCAFCKALFTVLSLEGKLDSSREYALWSMLSQQPDAHIALHIATHYPLLDSLPQRILLVMVDLWRNGPSYKVLIPQTRDNVFVRILNSSTVDYDVLKGWLSVCQNIHTEICSSKNRETTEYLQVIDCKNRKLVPADSLPYVTLSYVWGVNQSPQDFHYSEDLGHRLPPTIEDAIDVTLKLGYQYLWVDRYCINQQGTGNEEITQIQQMGSIYKNSDFTIIAAAGSDCSYGLPGVSRSRLQQAVVRLGQLELVNPGSIANDVLQRSRWSTRGWTFQEAYLSKRRIVFTDEQVYYECNGMYSYESFNVPLQNMHDEGSQILEQRYFRSRGRHGRNVGKIVVFPGGVTEGGYRPHVILDLIHDFSRRTFTYPSDKLIGFLGILKEFETWPHCVRNIWGSPISPESESYKVTDFLNSMIWLPRKSKRISSLPSWSWVGWDGVIWTKLGAVGAYEKGLDQTPPATIGVELITGQILDWGAFHDTYAEVNDFTKLSHFIHLSCRTIPIKVISEDGAWLHTHLLFRDGCYMPWKFTMYDDSFRSYSYTSVPLVNRFLRPGLEVFIMVFAEVGGRMERVGGTWLSTEPGLYWDGKPVFEKDIGNDAWTQNLKERYGERWYDQLVYKYQTLRVG